ncbi:malate synthase G [Rhizobium beringeri]
MDTCRSTGNFADFIANEVAPGTGIDAGLFWAGYQTLLDDLEPENKKLLAERDALRPASTTGTAPAQECLSMSPNSANFLKRLATSFREGADFAIETTDVDLEIATLAGPQLVVPVINARFALNAANARWGSLYDALYGTDAIPENNGSEKRKDYNPIRGADVISWVRAFLDNSVPLSGASWMEVTTLLVANSKLTATVHDGRTVTLADVGQFVGYVGNPGRANKSASKKNGLHIEILIDPTTVIGQSDLAKISDVWLESALTTIQDCEDSVAAVDAADKVAVYRNWLGLMKGDLREEVSKDGKTFIRKLSADRSFMAPTGENLTLPGRSLMLVRNVGHLMTTDAVKRENGSETPEGFLDAMVTTFCGLHDLGTGRNSRKNSIYIVKPKMHGPKEASLTNAIFDRVEDVLKLPRHTIKVGVMDEERRTSINLKETIRAVKGRLAFINTGFLDRTGDEIRTNMLADPVVRKNEIKSTRWLDAYERNNVDVGLKAGLAGKAQIGKGMWAKPDAMAEMLEVKIDHLKSGANTAWVPSPTAATLHATHYHGLDVVATQKEQNGARRGQARRHSDAPAACRA